ncbi:MAG TPA: FtsX-like permease family protein, partial [Vicinamibacterales bacterium]|nr:FtsX-like permease family protein [Vicinamibacterales bacterium]
GLTSAGFALMEALLFSRLPFDGGDRFVKVRAYSLDGSQQVALEPEDYARLAAQATSLAHLGALAGGRANVALPSGDLGAIRTAAITPSSLALLPYAPARGRLLSRADAAPGAPRVAIVRDAFWRRGLAGRDDVIGLTIEVGGQPTTIVGVVPDAFEFPNGADLWTPIDESFLQGRGRLPAGAQLFGVLAPGQSLDALRGQLQTISATLSTSARAQQRLDAIGFTDLGDMAVILSTTLITILLAVLVVIAANVANLILARSFSRAREFALRSALGASRRRLIAQISTEVLVIGSIAAVLGTVGANAVLRQLNGMDDVPIWIDFTAGPLTACLVAGATLLATAVAGAWPALRATRPGLPAGLQGGPRTGDVRFGRLAGVMVTVQIAISIVLLNGALLLAQGFAGLVGNTAGLPRNVLVAGMPLNAVRPGADAAPRPLSATEIERIVSDLPGVHAAGLATSLPGHNPSLRPIEIEPEGSGAPAPAQQVQSAEVMPSFFAVLDAGVVSGRMFTEADRAAGAPAVAIVNTSFVQKFLHGAPPIGRRLRTVDAGAGPWREIVGVVPDLGMSAGDPAFAAGYYVPLAPGTNRAYLALRVSGDPLAHSEPLRRAISARDPSLFLDRVERLEDVNADDRGFFAGLSVAFLALGIVTLVLALAGVYAMMSLIVTRRTREIGVRLALGATTSHILRAIVGRAAAQVLSGAAIGLLLAWISLDARQILAARIGEGSIWTLPAVVGLLVAAGLAAAWWPVRRALGVRPVDALRVE